MSNDPDNPRQPINWERIIYAVGAIVVGGSGIGGGFWNNNKIETVRQDVNEIGFDDQTAHILNHMESLERRVFALEHVDD